MVWSRNYGRRSNEEAVSNIHVVPQHLRIDAREIKACLCAVLEEDEADDFSSSNSGKSEGYVRNIRDGVDLLDLLFDETD